MAKKKKTKKAKKPPARARKEVDPDIAKLPAALRKNAEALVDSAKRRLAREAMDALALAKASLDLVARNLYQAGRALVVLKKPGYAEAAGFAGGFYELCGTLDLSRASADRLVDAAREMSQEQYAAFKADRADALLDLATATKEDDTAAILRGDRIRLWATGPLFDVKKAKTAEVRAAAKQVRGHYTSKDSSSGRGRTASSEERALEHDSNQKLHTAGSSARAKVRATKPGKPSVFDLSGLSARELERAVRALAR